MALHFIDTYKVSHKLGWGEKKTFKELAKECGLEEVDTRRMIRLAMTHYLFTEPEEGYVMHTAGSFELVRNSLLEAWIGLMIKENWPPMLKVSLQN